MLWLLDESVHGLPTDHGQYVGFLDYCSSQSDDLQPASAKACPIKVLFMVLHGGE